MADEVSHGRDADTSGRPADRHPTRPPLRSPLGWLTRTRQAIAERDLARSERDAARKALKAARAERDAARAERDAAREALAAARADAIATRELAREVMSAADAEREARLETLMKTLLDQTRRATRYAKEAEAQVRLLHRELLTDIQALDQLLNRYSPEATLPPIAGWALSPVGLLALTDVIETRKARTVLECGSGTSTLWMAYALKHIGHGQVIALEHLPEYAENTRDVIRVHSLSDFAEVRDAPLVPHETSRGQFLWYGVDASDLPGPIDVLLVDGPPGGTGRHARYPAISVLRDRLAPNAVIVADDTERDDEREILEFWEQDEPRLRRVDTPGPGITVLALDG